MKCIILVGYMCVGKTTIGKALAHALNKPFYDLDWYIEERFRETIPQIFAERGEEGFRNLEQRMLYEVAAFENIVLSCGGGTPAYAQNMAYMKENAITIYLKADVPTILKHLAMSRTVRPLLADKSPDELNDFITQQLEVRTQYYEQADYTIPIKLIDGFDAVKRIVNDIIALINSQDNT